MLSLPDFKEKNVVICFATEGQRVSFKNDNLLITDGNNNTVLQATCYKIFSLWIVGNTTITSGILERSKKFAFSIYMLSHGNRPYGLWSNATEGNFLLRKKQYGYNDLAIARSLVVNKINNQQALLKSIRKKTPLLHQAIESMNDYKAEAMNAYDLKGLLGMEGVASRLFFSYWFDDTGLWTGRKPRAKQDVINTTMDIGYTYLFNVMECMLNLYGFDLYQGVYHRCFYQRKSLVCDLVEPFRCIIDKQIKKAIGLKQLQPNDFMVRQGQYVLKYEKNRDYTRWLMGAILEHKEAMFKYVQEYYRCFIRSKAIEEFPTFHINESTC